MSEDRIRRAFDDLSRQADNTSPEASLGALMNTPVNNRWSYMAVAAALVLVIGGVAAAFNAFRTDDTAARPVATAPDQTTNSTDQPSPSSTTPAASTTSVTTPSSTTVPETTSTVATASDPVGWHVIDVASDDVLNVRSGPSAGDAIVGTLAYNADMVNVLPRAGNPIGGDAWYGVLLADGTEGFVNSRFLGRPAEWDRGLANVPCTAADSDGDETATASGSGDASAVVGLFQVSAVGCDRYVIVLGIDNIDVYESAARIGGPVRVTSGGTRVTVDLPASITGVAPQATNVDLDDALALTVLPVNTTGAADELEVRFLHEGSRLAGVTVLAEPARIIIDVVPAPTGTGLDYAPVIGSGNTILEHPIDTSSEGLGVGNTVFVQGYARWFEAQGFATVSTADGVSPTDVIWSGPSITSSDGGTAGIYALWIPTWGEFTFTVDLSAGSYELFIGEECMTESGDSSVPCGVTDSFDVAP